MMPKKLEEMVEYSQMLGPLWTMKAIAIAKRHLLQGKVTGTVDFDRCVKEIQKEIPSLIVHNKLDPYTERPHQCGACNFLNKTSAEAYPTSCADAVMCTQVDKLISRIHLISDSNSIGVITYYKPSYKSEDND